MLTLNMENLEAQWLDNDTFKIVFDGGMDEDGDSFFYCCEYWKDADEWHFQKIYEDDYTDADFTENQIAEIKAIMENLMENS